jgi:hypothetical protein
VDYEPLHGSYNKQVTGFCVTCTNPFRPCSWPDTQRRSAHQLDNRHPFPNDWNNFQPRLGVAYQATLPLCFAADSASSTSTLLSRLSNGFSQTTSYNNYNTSAPLNSVSTAFPTGVQLANNGSSLGLKRRLARA